MKRVIARLRDEAQARALAARLDENFGGLNPDVVEAGDDVHGRYTQAVRISEAGWNTQVTRYIEGFLAGIGDEGYVAWGYTSGMRRAS